MAVDEPTAMGHQDAAGTRRGAAPKHKPASNVETGSRRRQGARANAEALREARDRLEAILQGIADGITVQDTSGHLLYANAAAARMIGYPSVEGLLQAPLAEALQRFEILDESGQPLPLDQLPGRRALRGERSPETLVRYREITTGNERWTLVRATPILDDQGQVQYAINVLHDVTEQKRAEQDLTLYREVITHSSEAIAIIDLQGRYLQQNAAHRALIGYDDDELRGKTPAIHLSEEAFRAVVDGLARDGQYRGELTSRTKDGTLLDVELSAFTVRDEAGDPVCYVGIKRDITERKRAEEARLRLAALVESSDDAIIGKTLDGIITDWSPGAQRLYGYTAEEVIGKPISILMPPDQPDELPRIMQRLKRGQRIEHYETKRVRKDSKRIDVSVSVSPLEDTTGRILGCATIARDVTQRKRAEERQRFLAQASALLAASLDYPTTLASVAQLAVPALADWCLIDMVEDDGSIRRLAVAHADPGRAEQGRTLRERYAPDPTSRHPVVLALRSARSRLLPEIDESVLETAARDVEQLELLRTLALRSGMIVPLVARGHTLGMISLFAAESGRRYGPADLALAEDLAYRAALAADNARLYAAEQAARAAAEEASRAKDGFLAVVSHELRTPLTAMLGWVRLLRSGRLDAASAARALETIERNARSQSQLVSDLLDVSSIVTGKLRLDTRPIELTPVIHAALDSVRPAAVAKGIDIQTALDRLAGPVLGDSERLQQVVWNLLSNAVKFTPAGGRVQVRLVRQGTNAEITVADTGQGISPEFLPYLFGRFRQADGTSTRPHGGLGLGLAIVRHLVELHGGTVRAMSNGLGKGATFAVTLPLTSAHPRPGEPDGASSTRPWVRD